jgi:hypothetical protein
MKKLQGQATNEESIIGQVHTTIYMLNGLTGVIGADCHSFNTERVLNVLVLFKNMVHAKSLMNFMTP